MSVCEGVPGLGRKRHEEIHGPVTETGNAAAGPEARKNPRKYRKSHQETSAPLSDHS
jgi:hypothetical protein